MLQTNEIAPCILPRSKWWWIVLALLLSIAGWLYFRGYNVSLPFFAHVDEPNHLVAAQHLIDDGTARAIGHDTYPPGLSRLNYLLLKFVKPSEAHHGTMLPPLRLITICTWMLVIVLIALLGAMMFRPLTGLIAASIWIVNPWIVDRAHWVLPDGYLTLFTLLALWLALVGYLNNRRSFSTASVYSIMLAIVFKTQAIFVSPIIVFMPLVKLWRQPNWRKDALQQTFWNCVRFAFFLFWLLLLYPTLEAENVPYWPASLEAFGSSVLVHIQEHLALTLRQFQTDIGWLATTIGGMFLWRYRQYMSPASITSILLSALVLLIGTSLFGRQSLRQFFTLGALLSLLYAVSLTVSMYLLGEGLTYLPPVAQQFLLRFHRVLPASIITVLLVISLLPSYRESDAIAHNFTLHDRRNDLAKYMDTSVPPGTYITNQKNIAKTFDRAWGGYNGKHDFRWLKPPAILSDKPIEQWRELRVEYAIMPHLPLLVDPGIYSMKETVLLKTYPIDPNFRGPDMVILRLYPMQFTANGQLGSIHLVGYDLNTTHLLPGDVLVFRHYWRADSPTAAPKHVFNHLLDNKGRLVAQTDYIPLFDERRPTSTWNDPDEILLGREFVLNLPTDLKPDQYSLTSGFNDEKTGILLTPDDRDRIYIATITVIYPQGQSAAAAP